MSLQVQIHKKLGAFTLDVTFETRTDGPELLGLLGRPAAAKATPLNASPASKHRTAAGLCWTG